VVAWERGWQPGDLVHAYGRKSSAPDRRLLVQVVAADAATWRTHPQVDPGWIDQVDDLDAAPVGDGPVVAEWAAAERVGAVDALWRAAELVALLWTAPPLPPIGDPPSTWGSAKARRPHAVTVDAAGVDQRMLARVRALLAKAESTEFAPEAEALTEKAQELAARYAIDHALVTAAGGATTAETPVGRRILIHDPYAKGKANLLSRVGEANRCQAVWSKELGFCTIFGFPTDVAVTDVLYTSLVSQCSAAMVAASSDVASPRGFRESFVVSFAVHIGDRLRAATAATLDAARADHGDDLLPVLASRHEQVRAARHDAFPQLKTTRVRTVDRGGWVAGRAAAELARLDVAKAVGT